MSNGINGADIVTAPALDTLLRAVDTMPGIDDAAWDLDCFRTALRIARATEAPGDLERASFAYEALSPDSRSRLLKQVTVLARQRATVSLVQPMERQAGGMAAFISSLIAPPPNVESGATAKSRLMRDIAGTGEVDR
ncbi:MAG TPA: hypothetical protein VD978_29730 [Azospirillum sp.]|nr:hypothetical protein [Azospirillum sp.]